MTSISKFKFVYSALARLSGKAGNAFYGVVRTEPLNTASPATRGVVACCRHYCAKPSVGSSDSDIDNQQKPEDVTQNTTVKDAKTLLDESLSDEPLNAEPEFPTDNQWRKYKDYNDWQRDQGKHSYRPNIDPAQTSIILFPGQGSQFVGMGSKLLAYPAVQDIYHIASGILGYDLLHLCLKGPKAELDRTVHCQPAIFVTSIAALEKLREENPKAIENCVGTAGFSVGEYASMVFAGMLSFEEGLEVVKKRAEAMQKASEEVSSGMMTVFLGADNRLEFACHTARRYCTEKLGMEEAVCEVANYLYPECKVIAGNTEALEFIEENAGAFGIRRTKRLPVSGAFHTKLMYSATGPLREILKTVTLERPLVPVHSNVTSTKFGKLAAVPRLLADQLHKPVKWEQIQHVLYERGPEQSFPQTFEVGPRRHLGSMLKMTNKRAYMNYRAVGV